MLCGWSGGRIARPTQLEEGPGGGCHSGGWTGDRSNSDAPHHRCFCRKPGAFVQDSVEGGSVIHTDGLAGYLPLEGNGYQHDVTILRGKKKTPSESSELMPRVHRVIGLLKPWLMGTHQGAVSHKHLDYYLDEFSVPIQSAAIKKPRQALLPPRAASGSCRACSSGPDSSPRRPGQKETTICRGTLSQADTPLVR